MKIAIIAILVVGCGGHANGPASPPAQIAELPAMRWVPASPTFVVASHSVEHAQRSLRALLDVLGTLGGVEPGELASGLFDLIGVDPLHPDPLAAIGIDPQGSWAAFSEDLSPTVVIHLAAPELMAAFLDHQRERGLATQSVIVDTGSAAGGASGNAPRGVEVFSAALSRRLTISWAIAGDWMWVHFAPPSTRQDATRWLTASREPHSSGWMEAWTRARTAAGAAAGVVGFFDPRGAIASSARGLSEAAACVKLVEPVGKISIALEGDDRHLAMRLAADVGSTAAIRSLILQAPSGWAATAAPAAIAAQWNLDLVAVRAWLRPCLGLVDPTEGVLAELGATGVRAARGLVLDFDPDAMSGSGAIALDVTHPTYFERQLDRVPLRKALERSRTYGGHKGFSLAIPFTATVDYVIEDGQVAAALGDGVLARVFAASDATSAGEPPIFALDLSPPAMSANAWATVIQAIGDQQLSGSPGPVAKRAAERLMQWRDGHLRFAAEPSELVLSLSGRRR
jgi:hypothetical protein